MRHVGSLLLALVLAPLAWVLTGVGLLKYSDVRAQFEDGLSVDILLGLLALLGAGALYAILVLARLSPIGPALAGAAYLGAAVWYAVAPASFLDVFPYEIGDVDLGLPIPAAGLSALIAVPLLATLMSPRRWRRYDRPAVAGARGGPDPVPPGAQYGPPGAPYGPPPGYPAPGMGVPVPAGGLGMSSPVPTPEQAYGPPATTAFPAAGFPAAPYPPAGSPAAPTTAFSQVPTPDYTRPPAAPQPPQAAHESTQPVSPPAPSSGPPAPAPPTSAPPAGADEPTTTVLPSGAGGGFGVSDDRPTTRLDTEATQLVKGPPPPDAYPRPAWSAPTPPPITPPKPASTEPDDDPEATQPRR
ncbi:hypothetical protein K1W54_09725 [Micromonospora sp. CPCC 205371]|nr:hypothetical protein [Micromonospora sp. CPCC 205371]